MALDLTAARELSEEFMEDELVLATVSSDVARDDLGIGTQAVTLTEVWRGSGRYRNVSRDEDVIAPLAGGDRVGDVRARVTVPLTSPAAVQGQVFVVTSCARDASAEGLVLSVIKPLRTTFATSRRYSCREATERGVAEAAGELIS